MLDIDIISERTKLRPVQASDLEDIHRLQSYPETTRYNTLGIPKDRSVTKKILDDWLSDLSSSPPKSYTFAIENRTNADFIGLFGLKPWAPRFRAAEVWYTISPSLWGKGMATEVLTKALDFAFNELELHRIQAGVAVDNVGSIRVLEKSGFSREGRAREILPLATGWSDNYTYAILASDVQ